MRVVIDVSPLKSGHQFRGIGVYTKNLYQALKELDDGNEYILTSKSIQARADVVHYPFFDFFFLTLPWHKHAPTVVTIHDTIPLVFKDHYPAGFRGNLKLRLQKMSLNSASKIITDSKQSTNDVITYLHQQREKVTTVYLAADNRFTVPTKKLIQDTLEKYQLSKPYFLYVGDVNFNKNLPALLRAFAQIHSKHSLVMVSTSLSKMIPESVQLKEIIKKLDLEKRVRMLSQVPMDPIDDLIGLYGAADWYVQPSLYEGFGLPVLEAWACGTPVISSLGGSLEEIVGTNAVTFDPEKEDQLHQILKQVVGMRSGTRKLWIQKGRQRLKQFSWQKTAEQTRSVYEQVAGNE